MTDSPQLRLASDIGGTFTDTVLMSGDQVLATTKTLTTHSAPAEGALTGATRVLEHANRRFEDVDGMVHGTTLATNALIERRGATVATVCTEGFRDILEIGYERRYSQYDINLTKPNLLVPRHRSLTVPERMSVHGEVLRVLDERAISDLVAQLDATGASAVAVCLLHSYANPDHEQQLAEALAAQRPDLRVSLSSEVSPEAREFDRLCTTVANAYIQPLMAGYLRDFSERFAAAGLRCPILMMTAGGGMCTVDTASRFPIRLVESGPAGGALLAARIAQQLGLQATLSFDMGGTTAKLCLIDDAPQRARQFEIARQARFIKGSGMPVRIPVIDMIEIGAGGGSIASTDRLGRLHVGPQSAGSEPGPVAFDRGGQSPTVTDADLSLGYLDAARFAEGRLSLNAVAARDALAKQIAPALHFSGADAAERSANGVSRVVDENMASAARMHAVESGK
ncbi:MAG: hydantoinase/oxoprolinase family protein, partial [Pseudomonadota bacterium]